jgi:hypothetical protein
MAGSKTNFLEDKVLNLLRATSITAPATIYVALFTVAPGEAGGGTEVTGGAYARTAVTFSAPSGGQVVNSGTVTFPTPTAGWGTIVGWGLMDALTAGNMWYYSDQTPNKLVSSGDTVQFAAGAIVVSED